VHPFVNKKKAFVFIYYYEAPRSGLHKIKRPHPWASFTSTPRRRVGKLRKEIQQYLNSVMAGDEFLMGNIHVKF
jgi:hypothetical protein